MEWTVVTVIVALVGLGATIIKPLLALNTSIVTLTSKLDKLTEDLAAFGDSNAKSHARLWKKNEEQDATLDDHEHRITVLEERQ